MARSGSSLIGFVPPQLGQRPWALMSRDGGELEIGGLTGPVRVVPYRVPEGGG